MELTKETADELWELAKRKYVPTEEGRVEALSVAEAITTTAFAAGLDFDVLMAAYLMLARSTIRESLGYPDADV
jgi:hypothetical protein